ncbi:septation ring formation regulator EzrA [Halalkalibacillus halophilus]|uniref:septation ring formation regulator EzrA n=1 Tax=Halalkalibacillus halophilus TaxID=392827 RepID=UPI000416E554|nr:septation ring formation regulator EzrA [Halalkalibacillus halophilus]
MEYIVGLFIVVVAFILLGVFARKRVYNRVDELEQWKVQLMSRQVADELAKVKHLNLTGETEQLFESWRSEWDEINDHVFTNIEEDLLDAEESAEKYKFGKTSRVLNHVEQRLVKVEKTIDDIFEEVDRLLHSEQDSREEAEKIMPHIREVRKKVLQNGYQLGKAEVVFEVELDEIQSLMLRYEELTEAGNYSEAYQVIQEVKGRLDELNRKVEAFPELYRSCKQVIPDELDQLYNGLKEMRDDDFRVQHLGLEKEIQTHHETLLTLVEQLDRGNDDGVEDKLDQIRSRMVEIYDELEKEAMDKNYVLQQEEKIQNDLEKARQIFSGTKESVREVKQNYQLKEEQQEQQYQLEKKLEKLEGQANQIHSFIHEEDKPYSTIRVDIESWMEAHNYWQEEHTGFDEFLYNLRKDELNARDHIDELRKNISQVRQRLQKSNLPGVPNYVVELVEQSRSLIDESMEHLKVHPLDMDEISTSLKKAEKYVENATEQTELLIQQAELTERVIQYANRYRSKYPVLAANIIEAERLFRDNEYESALNLAGESLEEIEPGALQKIEKELQSESRAS